MAVLHLHSHRVYLPAVSSGPAGLGLLAGRLKPRSRLCVAPRCRSNGTLAPGRAFRERANRDVGRIERDVTILILAGLAGPLVATDAAPAQGGAVVGKRYGVRLEAVLVEGLVCRAHAIPAAVHARQAEAEAGSGRDRKWRLVSALGMHAAACGAEQARKHARKYAHKQTGVRGHARTALWQRDAGQKDMWVHGYMDEWMQAVSQLRHHGCNGRTGSRHRATP